VLSATLYPHARAWHSVGGPPPANSLELQYDFPDSSPTPCTGIEYLGIPNHSDLRYVRICNLLGRDTGLNISLRHAYLSCNTPKCTCIVFQTLPQRPTTFTEHIAHFGRNTSASGRTPYPTWPTSSSRSVVNQRHCLLPSSPPMRHYARDHHKTHCVVTSPCFPTCSFVPTPKLPLSHPYQSAVRGSAGLACGLTVQRLLCRASTCMQASNSGSRARSPCMGGGGISDWVVTQRPFIAAAVLFLTVAVLTSGSHPPQVLLVFFSSCPLCRVASIAVPGLLPAGPGAHFPVPCQCCCSTSSRRTCSRSPPTLDARLSFPTFIC
jgi:hypothetical protein